MVLLIKVAHRTQLIATASGVENANKVVSISGKSRLLRGLNFNSHSQQHKFRQSFNQS